MGRLTSFFGRPLLCRPHHHGAIVMEHPPQGSFPSSPTKPASSDDNAAPDSPLSAAELGLAHPPSVPRTSDGDTVGDAPLTPPKAESSPAKKSFLSPALAQRAAVFEQSSSPLRSTTTATSSSSPSSQLSAKKRFWERAFLQPSESSDDDDDLVQLDVLNKRKWLEQAFTPQGGGNMPDDDEDSTEDLTEDNGLVDAPPSPPRVTKVPLSPRRTEGIAYARTSPKRAPEEVQACADQDPYRAAYEVWYRKGLLSWKPASLQEAQPDATGAYRHVDSSSLVEEDENDENLPQLGNDIGHTRTASGKLVLLETIQSDEDDYGVEVLRNLGDPPPSPIKHVSFSLEEAGDIPVLPVIAKEESKQESAVAQEDETVWRILCFLDGADIDRLQESRSYSKDKSQSSPLLTVFGDRLRQPVSKAAAYRDYVEAYKSYVQDRASPVKANERNAAQNLLSMNKAI